MCSLSRSTSTCPGISRSPVNSAKAFLQLRAGADAGVDLDSAGEVHVAVDLLLTAAHLQRYRVVYPIAHGVTHQGTVCDGGRKRERGRVEFGEIHVEIDGHDVAFAQGRKLV